MEFQERKINRIPEYDYSTNGAYFVTICTQDRKKILCQIVGDGFPVLHNHENPILNKITDRILSQKVEKKDAV